jgi:hypothetical protein
VLRCAALRCAVLRSQCSCAAGIARTSPAQPCARHHARTRRKPRTRVVVLRCLRELCADGQLLIDLFVNYDCDLDGSNLFERLISGLVKMAQAALPHGADAAAQQQEQWLRQEALQCVASAAEALWRWHRERAASGAAALQAAAAAAEGLAAANGCARRGCTPACVYGLLAAQRSHSLAGGRAPGHAVAARRPHHPHTHPPTTLLLLP